ncbi:MAG: ribosome small subunit-dependent GTPase A [Polyangiaceae bacterium]
MTAPPHPPFPESYGWSGHFERARAEAGEGDREVGRVSAEFRGGYLVATASGTKRGSLQGKLRLRVKRGESPAPAVGDWVTLDPESTSDVRILRTILTRTTLLRRKAAGEGHRPQTMVANVDVVFVVSSMADDFNERRIERYLAVAREGGVVPVVVLTKADLATDAPSFVARVRAIDSDVAIHPVSVARGLGLLELGELLVPRRTIALLGSSGVGKSTLINHFLGRDIQETRAVKDDGKGRHTTTHRELFVLGSGALLLDTPGMRELGVYEIDEGFAETFDDVLAIAATCRFGDCLHENEPGCAVRDAVADGSLPEERFRAYRKLVDEATTGPTRPDKDARLRAKREGRIGARALRSRLRDKGRKV